jgi:hypothetical protein
MFYVVSGFFWAIFTGYTGCMESDPFWRCLLMYISGMCTTTMIMSGIFAYTEMNLRCIKCAYATRVAIGRNGYRK